VQNDKILKISVAQNRKSFKWFTNEIKWSEFIQKVSKPIRTTETYEQFMKLKKSQQDELKDVGGFVAGELKDNRRKAENVLNRYLVTLDADNIEPGQTQKILNLVDGLGCSYAVYSTRKHAESKPRLRIIVPTDRTMTTEEYEPIARKIASFIGMEIMDRSTFEPSRLMYWPSCSKNSEFVFKYADKPFASCDGLLRLYKNWRDTNEWPKVPNETEIIKKEISKQKDPLEKENIVGAFCKIYDIYQSIATFLPDVYEPGNAPDKYTYINGSVANGAVVYDEGKYLYSYHATDPASKTLCNSFDLVRIHKFGHLDEDIKEGTPTNRYPSYIEMCKFAMADEQVEKLFKAEKFGKAVEEFSQNIDDENDTNWISKLRTTASGELAKCSYNVMLILENDLNLKDKLIFDRFTGRFLIKDFLPWDFTRIHKTRMWTDEDEDCLVNYLEGKPYNIRVPSIVKSSLSELKMKKSTNVAKEYFENLIWDGIPRIDTLLIDYFGTEDNVYSREIIRKELVALVSRVMTENEVKFDEMIILTGKQGIGKSTFLRKLGVKWYTDSKLNLKDKDSLMILQKCIIVEIGELESFKNVDVSALKLFLSQTTDTFRAPYAREAKDCPRHCVFFGTTNESEFLRDFTGERRFWPIECGVNTTKKNIFDDLDNEVNQIWAEAMYLYKKGESLILSEEANKIARIKQRLHKETHPWEGPIREFVLQKVTTNWLQLRIPTRRDGFRPESEDLLVERDRICAAEIWCECLNNDLKSMKISDSKLINGILGSLEFDDRKLEKEHLYFGKDYGKQRGFKINYLQQLQH